MNFAGLFTLQGVAISTVLGITAHAETSLDLDHDFWRSFAAPDQSLDVKAELPDGLLMSYEEPSGGMTSLSYDAGLETFALVIDGVPVTDLVTDVSDPSRPAFTGAFNMHNEPGITGFVDLDAEGRFIVELTSSATANRMLVDDVTHEVIAFGMCKCPATYQVLICEKIHCDQNPPPFCNLNDTVRCTWVTSTGDGTPQ